MAKTQRLRKLAGFLSERWTNATPLRIAERARLLGGSAIGGLTSYYIATDTVPALLTVNSSAEGRAVAGVVAVAFGVAAYQIAKASGQALTNSLSGRALFTSEVNNADKNTARIPVVIHDEPTDTFSVPK